MGKSEGIGKSKTTRDIVVLLKIVKEEYLKGKNYGKVGFCTVITKLSICEELISHKEYLFLIEYLIHESPIDASDWHNGFWYPIEYAGLRVNWINKKLKEHGYVERVRSINELLILLKTQYLVNFKGKAGLCIINDIMLSNSLISYPYNKMIERYLRNNSPGVVEPDGYWFELEDSESRIAWLDEHIKLTKDGK